MNYEYHPLQLKLEYKVNLHLPQFTTIFNSSTMNYPSVKIISECFIKPRFLSDEAKKPTYLSPWDLAMMSLHYIQKGLLYPLPNNQDFSLNTFMDDLKDSISATLTHFHPLVAGLATIKQQNPPSFTIFINPDNIHTFIR
ncbi:putative transferase [Helianthus anomalus]